MSQQKKLISFSLFGMAVLCAWLFIGVVAVDRMEDESHHDLFVKKIPTFKFVFFDSYASDPAGEEAEYRRRMDGNGDWLPGSYELNEYLSYCKHRHGITSDNPLKARALCKAAAQHQLW